MIIKEKQQRRGCQGLGAPHSPVGSGRAPEDQSGNSIPFSSIKSISDLSFTDCLSTLPQSSDSTCHKFSMNEQNDYNEPKHRCTVVSQVTFSSPFVPYVTLTFMVGGEVNTFTDKLLSASPAWEAGVSATPLETLTYMPQVYAETLALETGLAGVEIIIGPPLVDRMRESQVGYRVKSVIHQRRTGWRRQDLE